MHQATTQSDWIKLANDLIELDYDAIDAYQAAIDRIDDQGCKLELRRFMGDHQRHTMDLAAVVREMGGVPKTEGDFKHVLTKGKVVLGSIIGDRGILSAMKSNEDATNEAYENAVQTPGVSARLHEVLQRNLLDERRHRAWIEERLAIMAKA